MMLSIFITFCFLLIRFAFANHCPLSTYCTCSSDRTVIQCTNRQLTNDLLLKLNSQLPTSTIVLNLSTNSLTSIKSLSNLKTLQMLDLSFNQIQYLPTNIFSKFPRLISLNLRNNSLKTIPKCFKKISNIKLNLSNNPFRCTCQFKSFDKTNILKNIICQNNKQFNEKDFCFNQISPQQSQTDSGNNSSKYFCQSIQMNTSKGYFYWPRTLINKTLDKKCPFGPAAWLSTSNEYARAYYTCSNKRQWINFDVSQCAFQTNISRIFDHLALNQTDLLLDLVKYLPQLSQHHMKLDDIILLIDLIDEQQEKYQNQDRIMLIYHLTDFILQIKHDFIHLNQYQNAILRLRLIIERLLDFTNQSWLYIGKELTAMTIQSPLSSTLCFIPNRSLLKIICEIDHQYHKSQLATIQFSSNSNNTNQYSLFRIIFYRQSTLFISNITRKINNNPVIYIRPVSRYNLSTIKVTFYSQLNQASIGIWQANQTSWQIESSRCQINEKNQNLISTNCIFVNNNSYSITYFNQINLHRNIFLNTNYSQIAICISSTIASICLLLSIIIYLYFYKIHTFPRLIFHCLINYWFSLGILLPLFAFGMQQNQYSFLCQFIANCLYYLCLITIIWLTLLTFSVWRQLKIIFADEDHRTKSSIIMVEYDENGLPIKKSKSKPVIQFYMLAHGIALVICGINIGLSQEKYMTNKICFLNHFDSLLILIISILVFIFLILALLLFARNYIKHLTNKTIHLHILSDESEIQSDKIFSSKANEITPMLISFNPNSHSSDIDHQHESINILLSILFQLILLIFLFLSSLTIYLHPLQSFQIRFEHIIYSHFYAFFVLFLAFYILSFYVLSRYHNNRKKNKNHLSNMEPPTLLINSMINADYDIPSFTEQLSVLPPLHSHYASNVSEVPLNNDDRAIMNDDLMYGTKHLTNVISEFYNCPRYLFKTNETLPFSSIDTFSQETIGMTQSQRNSFYERSLKRSTNSLTESPITRTRNTQSNSSPLISSQSYIRPRSPPSQAIIRPLPITRLSSRNTNKNVSNFSDIIQSTSPINPSTVPNTTTTDTHNSYRLKPSPSIEHTDVYSNKIHHQESSNEELLVSKNPPDSYTQVVYIDDDEHSVSLKSSETSTNTITIENNHSQTSSSSSSSEFSNDFDKYLIHSNQIILHESSV